MVLPIFRAQVGNTMNVDISTMEAAVEHFEGEVGFNPTKLAKEMLHLEMAGV